MPNCAYNADSAKDVWHIAIIQAMKGRDAPKLIIISVYNSRNNACAFIARFAYTLRWIYQNLHISPALYYLELHHIVS